MNEDMLTVNKHLKTCSKSLGIQDIQIKTIIRYTINPLGRLKLKQKAKKPKLINCW